MLEGLIAAGKPEQASQYIRKVQSDIETITPRRYCENELVDLLCSSFAEKAQHAGARLDVDAKLPRELGISDAELCAVLSNALENALHAVAELPEEQRTVSLYCALRLEKLLIEVKNPYAGELTISPDGRPGHGYGCRSIQTIAARTGGLCEFKAQNGIFCLQIVLPLKNAVAPV